MSAQDIFLICRYLLPSGTNHIIDKAKFLSPKHTTSVVLSVPFDASIPSGIEDIPLIGKRKFLIYVPKRAHASPNFNLPNYPASRQEKFQEFLRRPGCSVSSREDEVSDGNRCRKPGNASIGGKQAQDLTMAAGEVPSQVLRIVACCMFGSTAFYG
jgi:hypothetical protein